MASILLPSASITKANNLKQPHCYSTQSTNALSFGFHSDAKSNLHFSAKGLWCNRSRSTLVKAQLNELEGSKIQKKDVKQEEEPTPVSLVSEASISEFMSQVSSLVKLVDSRDVAELQLKQSDCELLIRKKEALPQPSVPDNAVMIHSPPPAAVTPPASAPVPASTPATVSSPTQAHAPSPPSGMAESSHPSIKCPMAGTFYRCPGPGEPPVVKVGDKVQKGQVVCIVEAMKLMNEIEADRSGTIVEVLVDDGKPVSVDTPLFVIAP